MAERSDGTDPRPASRPDEATARHPHDGWAGQPQSSYDLGDSGGWGGPVRRDNTGPVPRLSRVDPAAKPAADSSARAAVARPRTAGDRSGVDTSPTTGETSWHVGDPAGDLFNAQTSSAFDAPRVDDEHEPLVVDTRRPAGRDTPRGGTASGEYSQYSVATASSELPRALVDPTFRLRATRVLVPFTYVVVVLFLVLDYMRSIFDHSGGAATNAGDFVGLLILLFVGLVKIVAVTFVVRLVLELCLNVAEMHAGSERGRRA